MIYRVTKKFEPRGAEIHVGNFKDLITAKAEIKKRLTEDARVTIRAIYCLYEGYDLIEEIDQTSLEKPQQQSSDKSDSQQQSGMGSRFSPTPLPTAPRPSGMPPSSWKREDDGKKDK